MKKILLFLAGLTMSASAFAGVDKLYGVGGIDGWGSWSPANGLELQKVEDGVFTWSGKVSAVAYFAFASEIGDWDIINAHRFSPATKDAPAVIGDNAMVANVDASWKIEPGEYTFRIDTNNMVLNITETGTVEKITTYVIHGQLDGLTDSDWKDYPLVAETEDLWTGTFTPSVTGGEFGVQQQINGSSSEWYASGVSFDPTNTTYALTGEVAGNCVFDFPAGQAYKFTFVPSTATLTITSATAIDAIESENAPAEYFNMQGVRVANPRNGMYIVRQGNKVTKQVIR